MILPIGHDPNPARRIRALQGARLRELRALRSLTLRTLSERMCEQEGITITSAAISEWERGGSTPRQFLQVAVAKALDVPWSMIFSLDEEAVA